MPRSLRQSLPLAIGVILGLSLAIRLPTAWIPHVENDEVIYQELSRKASFDLASYTVRATNLNYNGVPLAKLLPNDYDKPLFLHPPLFVWSLALIRRFVGEPALPLLPIAAGLMIILLIYLAGRERFGERAGICAAAVAAVGPVLLLASTKIWIDSFLCAWLCASYCALTRSSTSSRGLATLTLAGVCYGLALVTKATALCFAPVPALFFLKKRIPVRKTLLFWIPALVICAPWFVLFYRTYGMLLPNWYAPSAENMKHFPQMYMVVHRPFYFYFSHLILVAPLYLFCLPVLRGRERLREDLPEAAWALCFLIPFSIIGMRGGGYQCRYILSALPPLALLSGSFLAGRGPRLLLLATVLGTYSLAIGLANIYLAPHSAEVLTPFAGNL